MQTIIPYLNFAGKAEQALDFYQQCFDGEVIALMRFGDTQTDMPIPSELLNNIMHCHFKAGELEFMGSDGMPGEQLKSAGNIELNLNFSDLAHQQAVFNKLSENGDIIMGLQDTFWQARFGRVCDQFAINWMLNCPLA
ncbi:VOC family protein [Agarivorans sp. Toyoura001]|uniref:VOC family protein n=1 Tax=unclassified Agarivorans TaxID=2636026 RepID=UPI0010F13E89|nr:VOC family protein [Agarivorans sp. Toyoura001]GDY26889.1 VOC family protein [Agarivorans sp. Toyoura001]